MDAVLTIIIVISVIVLIVSMIFMARENQTQACTGASLMGELLYRREENGLILTTSFVTGHFLQVRAYHDADADMLHSIM